MTWQEIRDRRMRVLLELVGVDEAEKLGVAAFSLALDRLETIDAKHAEEPEIVDCAWCNGKGMRYNVDAGFQCKHCKGTGKTDA